MKNTLMLKDNDKTYIFPKEDKEVVLHNPDMGWALYDNHAMISRPLSSGKVPITGRYENHVELREDDYTYPGVDNIVLIFTWSDIEIEKDVYDFTYFDEIYDFWKARGKNILLGMSTTTKVWYGEHGQGAPTYLIEYLKPDGVRVRGVEREGIYYEFYVCDVGNPYYLERLRCFLKTFDRHLKETNRPIYYMDLRGYGMWGEWHTGFQYPDVETKRKALAGVLDAWATSFPDAHLALSYSYDPDEPNYYYIDPNWYHKYLEWSAFDLAMQYPNITIRRDGAGVEIKNTERMFCEELFRTKKRGPFTSEGCNGYDPRRTVEYIVADGLSMHPNYFTVIGWGGSEARRFLEDYPDLVDRALRNMGYRLVLTFAAYRNRCLKGEKLTLDANWINRAVGRAPRDFEIQILLENNDDVQYKLSAGKCISSDWVKDEEYFETYDFVIPEEILPGEYFIGIGLYDALTKSYIGLALREDMAGEKFYRLGTLVVE